MSIDRAVSGITVSQDRISTVEVISALRLPQNISLVSYGVCHHLTTHTYKQIMASVVPMAASIKPSISSLKLSATARFGFSRASPNLCCRVSSLHLSSGMCFRSYFPSIYCL